MVCFPEFHEIMKTTKTAMLTTRATSGHLHSRAMNPAGRESFNLTDYHWRTQ